MTETRGVETRAGQAYPGNRWEVIPEKHKLSETFWAVQNRETGEYARAGYERHKRHAQDVAEILNRDPAACPDCLTASEDAVGGDACERCGGWSLVEAPE
jgi:hypothetical protein